MPRTTRRVNSKPANAATLHGLLDWHKALIEKLGWMVLAKGNGHDYKITNYKKSIDHFISTARGVAADYDDSDVSVMSPLILRVKNKNAGKWSARECIINIIRIKQNLRVVIQNNSYNGSIYIDFIVRIN
jgi:phage major head subunit gpT-like protein